MITIFSSSSSVDDLESGSEFSENRNVSLGNDLDDYIP